MKQLAEKLRNKIFWSLDALKRGKLIAHYRDIAQILENYDTPESQKRRANLLKQLLNHASDTTEFYKEYKNLENLEDFPVIDKCIIRDNFDAFQSIEYIDKSKQKVSTSGSSGTPFMVYQNSNKVIRNRADTIYLQGIVGFKIGYRLYYIRQWLEKYRLNNLTRRMRNIEMVNVADFSDNYLEKLITTLRKDTSTKVLLSYSSALREICNYLERVSAKPIETNISSIIAMAEGLSDDTRDKLIKYFNTNVYLRYSNQENGILSLQLSKINNSLQINWASYFIEILHPEKDIPVEYGELGRVVVTDLFNYCTPFIRYDTGDFAIMTQDGGFFKGSPVFLRVEGRKMDIIYNTQGLVISGYNIHHLESYPDIKQFQFVQEDRAKYRIKLVTENRLKSEEIIINHFKTFLGTDASIEIVYVEEIKQLASGKRRLIINNYQKGN
ncbi:phenylacetate--CoA ligase family protein [Zobellia nedashkovskayae]|uniref:phenylacetate--CoA ligase family protein n=1 Tax=Zobellia nedashkovskayae TaxID=2779510 RepID=UPI00188C9794|nr:phenylacetate--CoA ligase family protein [Zobellia nedashkovskayae]